MFYFTTAISCDKTDDGGDGQSAGTLKMQMATPIIQ